MRTAGSRTGASPPCVAVAPQRQGEVHQRSAEERRRRRNQGAADLDPIKASCQARLAEELDRDDSVGAARVLLVA